MKRRLWAFLQGSALAALTGDSAAPYGAQSVRELMHAVDEHVAAPERLIDLPFAMSIEGVFAIQVCTSTGLHHHAWIVP